MAQLIGEVIKLTRIHRNKLEKASSQEGEGAHPLHPPLDPPLERGTFQLLPASLWYDLPLETEDKETRVKFSRYPLSSISPSEWNKNFTLSPIT